MHSDPLDIFAGTWIATNPNDTAPYFILRFEKRDGKLIGTMNRFRFAVAGAGRLVGRQQTPGEVPLSDLKIDGGLLSFTWRVNPPFEGAPATFVVEGTKVGMLVLSVSGDAIRKIMVDNPRASGMNPVVSLNRVSESELHELIRGAAVSPQPKASEQWEVTTMARLINTAEVQYKLAHGVYADYSTLFRSGQLKETGAREFTLLPGNLRREGNAAESDPIPGYSFRLLLSTDRKSYRVSMQQKTPGICRHEVSTDETGIVTEVRVGGWRCE